jgi:hypothetical protein
VGCRAAPAYSHAAHAGAPPSGGQPDCVRQVSSARAALARCCRVGIVPIGQAVAACVCCGFCPASSATRNSRSALPQEPAIQDDVQRDVRSLRQVRRDPADPHVSDARPPRRHGGLASRAGLCRGSRQDTRGKAYVVYEDIFDAKNAVDHLSGFNVKDRCAPTLVRSSAPAPLRVIAQ